MADRVSGSFGSIGVLGGGQLGRMLALDAHRLGLRVVCLDPAGAESSAAPVCQVVQGSFAEREAVLAVPGECVTVEIEHVNVDALEEIVRQGRPVNPAPSALRLIADKALQKEAMRKAGVPVVEQRIVPDSADTQNIEKLAGELGGFPVMLKARKLAYDGRGNAVVRSAADIPSCVKFLGRAALTENGGVYLEKWAPFRAEIAVIVARDMRGNTRCYDVVETRQADNICRIVVVPPSIDLPAEAVQEAQAVATRAVSVVEGAGVFAVEMFWLGGSRVLYNEMAPRPHNSGHLSIEANVTSQFEQHARCVSGLPLGDTSLRVGAAAMINILGAASEAETLQRIAPALTVQGAKVHWYGKGIRPGRKLGHITVTAPTMAALRSRLVELGEPLDEQDVGAPSNPPVVGIIMGSDSDLPTMKDAAEVLEEFGIPYELSVVSAHRTPERMFEYAKAAKARGLQVIIAGAGGAAHLPGMVAALTPLPVIGVPIKTSTLNGQDSLLSIVQMPGGIPVATVAIGNAKNAGLLAARMLAAAPGASALAAALEAFHDDQRSTVLDKAAHLDIVGHKQYLSEYNNKDKSFMYLPIIRAAAGRTLDSTQLRLRYRGKADGGDVVTYVGKVRDRYDDGKNVVLITTDRLTAFDRPLAKIPFKGAVLNQVSLWWFQQTRHIIKNQLLAANLEAVVHPNVTLARRCKTFPIEFVMRGYMAGSTSTSIWSNYKNGVRKYCGHALPDNLVQHGKLPQNLCTPTTKSDEHDELIDGETIVRDGWMTREDWEFCERKAHELFAFGQKTSLEHGLILVDTKYEFGRDLETGEILLIDEIHTPDCSRYWIAETYDSCMRTGKQPEHIDKEFIRLWFRDHCDPYKDAVLPPAPLDLVCEMSRRYIFLYEKITGQKFRFPTTQEQGDDVNGAVQRAVDRALDI